MGNVKRVAAISVALIAAVLASGCSGGLPSLPKVSDLNPFKEKQQPMPGTRIPIMPAAEKIPGELASGDQPIVLVAEHENDAWAQPGGEATNAPGHLALGAAVHQSWSADAGSGSGKMAALRQVQSFMAIASLRLMQGGPYRPFPHRAVREFGGRLWCLSEKQLQEAFFRWEQEHRAAGMAVV